MHITAAAAWMLLAHVLDVVQGQQGQGQQAQGHTVTHVLRRGVEQERFARAVQQAATDGSSRIKSVKGARISTIRKVENTL